MLVTKPFIRALIQRSIDNIHNGTTVWTVANQNDVYLYQDALDNLDKNFGAAVNWFRDTKILNVFDWADYIANPVNG